MYDLCCGEGGVSTAALSLGWRVIGVDIIPQPNYPGEFILADALQPPLIPLADLVWVSPPCQGYSRLSAPLPHTVQPNLVNPLREVAQSLGRHYVIENVSTCHDLINPIRLCGFMFGLPLIRHRLFESSFLLPQPQHVKHSKHFFSIVGHSKGSLSEWRQVMGFDYMTRYGLAQSVPYAYTWYILTWFKALN